MKQAVVGIVEHQGKVLIGRKKKQNNHSMSEQWHVPGGKVLPSERPDEALRREIREEANIEISNERLLEQSQQQDTVVYWFCCTAKTTHIKAGSDLSDVRFVKREEVKNWCSQEALSRWPKSVQEYFEAKQT